VSQIATIVMMALLGLVMFYISMPVYGVLFTFFSLIMTLTVLLRYAVEQIRARRRRLYLPVSHIDVYEDDAMSVLVPPNLSATHLNLTFMNRDFNANGSFFFRPFSFSLCFLILPPPPPLFALLSTSSISVDYEMLCRLDEESHDGTFLPQSSIDRLPVIVVPSKTDSSSSSDKEKTDKSATMDDSNTTITTTTTSSASSSSPDVMIQISESKPNSLYVPLLLFSSFLSHVSSLFSSLQ
jgi:hypothetical protein